MATVGQRISGDSGLSKRAYVGYAAAFMIIPYACVLASSALSYWWRRTRPVSAKQINTLGFIVFGVQLLLAFLLAWWMPAQQGEMPVSTPAGIPVAAPIVATNGTAVPLPGKPFQLAAPPGWTVGDPSTLHDAVILDPSENVVITASAIPIVDVPPPLRDPLKCNDAWRKALGPELTEKEDLLPFPCSLLGHRVEARRTDFTLAPSEGGAWVRQVRVVAVHGDYLCHIGIMMTPSFAEEAGEDAVQTILAWVQATGPGDMRRRKGGFASKALPATGKSAAAGVKFTSIQPRSPNSKVSQDYRGRDMNFVEEHMRGGISAASEYETTTDGTALASAIDRLNRSLELAFTRLILEESAKDGGRK